MKALVTGGSGFVAGWVIKQLLERGDSVRATLRSSKSEARIRATSPESGERLEFAIADLTSDDGWAEAMAGVDAVLHVASPLGHAGTGEAELIEAAKDGTLRVLRAAVEAGVPRVVMTSSGAAATPPEGSEGEFDESLWTNPAQRGLDAYRRSKALAERAAWDYIGTQSGTTLTTILPGAIFGPLLSPETVGSVAIIQRMLKGMPGVPRIGLRVVDVRDVAKAHLLALDTPDSAGRRFIAVGDLLWMREVGQILHERFPELATSTPRELPDWLVRVASWFQSDLRGLVPMLGRRYSYSTTAARDVLGWKPRPSKDVVIDSAQALIDLGLATKPA
ncbi:MAG: NAD-dependent epimerase/dehydratase family protein [Microbacterium sp.]|uniref:NAD-dependent epimerase/dehydratase family protein n=1 Tax=Microbacterium sp. TaxID=51671 RepID=UPI0039E32810